MNRTVLLHPNDVTVVKDQRGTILGYQVTIREPTKALTDEDAGRHART